MQLSKYTVQNIVLFVYPLCVLILLNLLFLAIRYHFSKQFQLSVLEEN